MGERENFVDQAKISEQVERYEDMAKAMKNVTQLLKDGAEHLSDEERNLLSVAYKNVVGTRRASWRILQSMEQKASEKSERQHKIVKENRETVEKELNTICDDVIDLLDKTLIPYSKDGTHESQIFYLKMKGDYYRYKVEVAGEGTEREKLAKASEEAYKDAYAIAQDKMKPIHPIRLGLALNFSVYYYEIRNEPGKACELAKTAFDKALAELDPDSDDTSKDSSLILQLLRDNLTLWTNELGNEDGQQEEED